MNKSSSVSKFYDFALKRVLFLGVIISLTALTACNRSNTSDSSASFGKLATASGVDANNAPTVLSDTFSPSQKTIYLVAEAKQVAPGTRISASWTRNGTPVQVSDAVVAAQGYQNTNIEFHLNPGPSGFVPGNYKVQLLINGNAGPDASFTVK